MSEDLKPCPFCGAKPEILHYKQKTWGLVKYDYGCFFIGDGLPTRRQYIAEDCFAAWNRRTAPVSVTRFSEVSGL